MSMQKKHVKSIGAWILYCLLSHLSFAQENNQWFFGKYFFFETILVDSNMKVTSTLLSPCSDTTLSRFADRYLKTGFSKDREDLTTYPKTPMLLGVKLNPKLTDFWSSEIKSFSKSFQSYIIKDSSDAIVIALGITAENVQDYRYHVVANDSEELIPWSIPKLEQKYGAKKPYATLGTFNYPGKQILIEVVNAKNYNIRDGVVFDWRTDFRPIITATVAYLDNDENDADYYFNITDTARNRKFATRFHPHTGMPLNLKIPLDTINSFSLDFRKHETVPYTIVLIRQLNDKTDTVSLESWFLGTRYSLESKHFNKPGKYELIVRWRKTSDEKQILRFPFEVLPPPKKEKTISLRQALPYIIAALTSAALLFYIYQQRNKRKLLTATQARQTVMLQLRSLRSQLNPHFMFNALSSIQNLMNKKDTESANRYLSIFAGLTRHVLETTEHEMISVEDELKILNDYLLMEQLRFGFRYSIYVDEKINKANTEIPAMLLQPFVENAVKHGVSALQESGKIEIKIEQDKNDLVLSVRDNGKGFTTGSVEGRNSFGLKLSEERVELLNKMYKDKPASLNIESEKTGTTVIIKLGSWF